ncbi:oxidoreductase [Lithospermum erythrorhizon]|uniref:Oxidoreductase n=1 Tax=Lithospermum erythrorhizon TaxID=34254 RepID=A0AAV3PXN1_LITER
MLNPTCFSLTYHIYVVTKSTLNYLFCRDQRGHLAMSSSNEHSLPSQRLQGKVTIVTGGASGQNICKTLGEDPNVCYFHCDVTREDDVSQAVAFCVNKFGTLDIMVNNAGITGPPCSDIREFELSAFEKVFDVNVKGVFLGMKHAARVMIPLKKGSIISLCSVASVSGGLGPHSYCGSKHAVLGLTRNVAAELGKHGIRVNCISPYTVPTSLALAHLPEEERTEDAWAGFRAFAETNANLQGVELLPEDVANAVLFFASDESRYISGDNLMVDGGFTCVNHSFRVFR